MSLALSIASGLLAFAALRWSYLPLLICSGVAMAAMLAAMLWPPANSAEEQRRVAKRKVR